MRSLYKIKVKLQTGHQVEQQPNMPKKSDFILEKNSN